MHPCNKVLMDDDQLETLLRKHLPAYWLHSEETAFPLSQSEYFLHAEALDPDGKVLNTGILTPYNVDTYIRTNGRPPKGSTLRIKDQFEPVRLGRRDFNNVYVDAFHFRDEDRYYITYVTTFGWNHAFQVLRYMRIGEHYADIEHQMIEFNTSGKPLRMYFAAHGGENGMWVAWDKVEHASNSPDTPIVYVARGSHASYPKIGYWFRLYGAANDQTNRGHLWEPGVNILYDPSSDRYDPKTMGWIRWTRDVGNGAVGGLAQQAWWMSTNKSGDSERSIYMYTDKGYQFEVFQGVMVILITFIFLSGFVWLVTTLVKRVRRQGIMQ